MDIRTHHFREYPNPTQIQPCGNHVLVEMDAVSETFPDSGLVKTIDVIRVEENAQVRGRVIACGTYAWDPLDYQQPEAQPGDRVIIAKYCGILHDESGKKYRLIKDCEVMATLREVGSTTTVPVDSPRHQTWNASGDLVSDTGGYEAERRFVAENSDPGDEA